MRNKTTEYTARELEPIEQKMRDECTSRRNKAAWINIGGRLFKVTQVIVREDGWNTEDVDQIRYELAIAFGTLLEDNASRILDKYG